MIKYSHLTHEIIYKNNKSNETIFFFKKSEKKIDEFIKNIDKLNSKYFPAIYCNNMSLSQSYLVKYCLKQLVFYQNIDTIYNKKQIYWSEIDYSDGNYIYQNPKIALINDYNMSHPIVFTIGKNIHLFCINEDTEELLLYVYENFLDKWSRNIKILDGFFLNFNVINYREKYWLFTIQKQNNIVKKIIYNSIQVDKNWNFYSEEIIGENYFNECIFKFEEKIFNLKYDSVTSSLYQIELFDGKYEEILINDKLERNISSINVSNDWVTFNFSNANNNFYEKNFADIINRWNTRSNRIIMLEKYNEIGQNILFSNNKNILDIGFEPYNIYNLSYFNNYDVNYYQIDLVVDKSSQNKISYKLFEQNILDYTNWNFFNTIISFGVLGYIEFTPEHIDKYLFQISKLLIKNGVFYLKLDNKHMRKKFNKLNIVCDKHIYKYFSNYKEKYILGKNEFTFYTLKLK
jgi:hypothetical protein